MNIEFNRKWIYTGAAILAVLAVSLWNVFYMSKSPLQVEENPNPNFTSESVE